MTSNTRLFSSIFSTHLVSLDQKRSWHGQFYAEFRTIFQKWTGVAASFTSQIECTHNTSYFTLPVRIELTASRLTVPRSTNWAKEERMQTFIELDKKTKFRKISTSPLLITNYTVPQPNMISKCLLTWPTCAPSSQRMETSTPHDPQYMLTVLPYIIT
jgi:hypothetical protein